MSGAELGTGAFTGTYAYQTAEDSATLMIKW
ncbi:MAG: hypothetical protein CM15mV146_150 [uncultured marine virus]|nr:MAG: hypothetical protein CM15mV146_150 [uncultured marine virus]